ncbi:nuclease-related domain-containing protein [Alkalicoccobacillus murimartini]|uniref:nuclease-related domain-containing protein n=1 Tax=Alkalicoccobacillus murimartini TaxID=171685 RepID=UPI0027D8B0E5|nr:nuclease-related domain-containing protein [Alkalicoccobacillus murimartini]
MIVRRRSKPLKLLQFKALERRVSPSHISFPKIKEDLALREVGYRGEVSTDYYMKFLEQDQFYLVKDLRLRSTEGDYFQMDTVVVCDKYIAIIETKNISGRISFNESTNQMFRKVNDIEQVLPNPFSQVRRQRIQLTDWFLKKGWPLLPIVEFVALSNPSTFIDSSSKRLVPSEEIPAKLIQLQRSYQTIALKRSEVPLIAQQLAESHIPEIMTEVLPYQITTKDIRKGVLCPACSRIGMERVLRTGSWFCANCNHYSKDAHIQALEDYFLLIKPTITNRELRDFLQIHSSSLSHYLLNQLTLPRTNSNKYTYYTLSCPLSTSKA